MVGAKVNSPDGQKMGLFRIKTNENEALEVFPLLSEGGFAHIKKIEDKLLLVDENGDFYWTTSSYSDVLELDSVQTEPILQKIDLPQLSSNEHIKFETLSNTRMDRKVTLAIYQTNEKEITVA